MAPSRTSRRATSSALPVSISPSSSMIRRPSPRPAPRRAARPLSSCTRARAVSAERPPPLEGEAAVARSWLRAAPPATTSAAGSTSEAIRALGPGIGAGRRQLTARHRRGRCALLGDRCGQGQQRGPGPGAAGGGGHGAARDLTGERDVPWGSTAERPILSARGPGAHLEEGHRAPGRPARAVAAGHEPRRSPAVAGLRRVRPGWSRGGWGPTSCRPCPPCRPCRGRGRRRHPRSPRACRRSAPRW
jgi:hypothetical protein